MIDYVLVLDVHYPGTEWVMRGLDYSGLEWLDQTPKPTQAELDTLWESARVSAQNREADENRKRAYAQEADPLFFKAQRGEATQEQWLAVIASIKTRYPKV